MHSDTKVQAVYLYPVRRTEQGWQAIPDVDRVRAFNKLLIPLSKK
jgi:hypothetical protein